MRREIASSPLGALGALRSAVAGPAEFRVEDVPAPARPSRRG